MKFVGFLTTALHDDSDLDLDLHLFFGPYLTYHLTSDVKVVAIYKWHNSIVISQGLSPSTVSLVEIYQLGHGKTGLTRASVSMLCAYLSVTTQIFL